MLVKGKDVVRYHKDTDSEDDAESEIESSEEDDNDDEDEDAGERVKSLLPIALGDEEFVSQYGTCENCKEEFDVTTNNTRDCEWHTGRTSEPFTKTTH